MLPRVKWLCNLHTRTVCFDPSGVVYRCIRAFSCGIALLDPPNQKASDERIPCTHH